MWTLWHTLSLLLIVIVIGALGLNPQFGRIAFLANMALLALFTMIAGQGIVGYWRGLLIDERNRMSLSRLQMVLWMFVVLAGFLTSALSNLANSVNDPLKIIVPTQLWILLGISTTSLVGSPLIRSTKTEGAAGSSKARGMTTEIKVQRVKAALARQSVPPETVDVNGNIVGWKSPKDARIADLFEGDEVGNAAHLDLGKVQMLFFTLILVFTYAVALAKTFPTAAPVLQLPPLDDSMVALLGISHAGYLSSSAIPKG